MYGSNNLGQDQIRNRTNPPPNLFSIIEIVGGGRNGLNFFILLIDQDCSKENLHGRKFARVVRQVENRSQSHAYYHSRQSLKEHGRHGVNFAQHLAALPKNSIWPLCSMLEVYTPHIFFTDSSWIFLKQNKTNTDIRYMRVNIIWRLGDLKNP